MKHTRTPLVRLDHVRRRGFVFIDVAMGLALLGLITFALVASIARQQRAAQKLSDTRTATRLAEDSLASLQMKQPLPAAEGVKLTRLSDPAPAGYVWVRAKSEVGMSSAELLAMVPATAVPAGPAETGGTP